MRDVRLERMKQQYNSIPIPEELESVVRSALQQGSVNTMNNKRKPVKRYAALSAAAAAACFVIGLNTNQSFASAMSDVPVLGSLVKVVTFAEYTVEEDDYKATIEVPQVTGLEDTKTEDYLNQKYLEESKALFEQFKKDVQYAKDAGGAHLGLKSGYEIKTDNDRILAIKRYAVSTSNGNSVTRYDTIDKEREVLLTLPSLFKDDSYIRLVSDNIKQQMLEQYAADNNKFYWVEGIPNKMQGDANFQLIKADQSFYINAQGQLVVCFEKYEVAPGYMGTVEFIIPSIVISDALVSDAYIK